MMPYVFTFIGMFLRQWYVNVINPSDGGAVFLTAVGALLTAIGLWKTYKIQGGKYADRKRLGIAMGVHGAIWLAGLLLFGVVSWILGKIVYLIALVIGLAIAYFWFRSLDGSSSDTTHSQESDEKEGLDALPNLMYDGYKRWQLEYRCRDHAVYHDDDGNKITIRQTSVCRGNIQTDAGFFQSYQ